MTQYEMLAVLPGTLTETETLPTINSIKETVERLGAQDISFHDMGKSRLAYPMKHIRYGYYYILRFSAEPSQIKEIEHKTRLITNVLRLTVQISNPASQTIDLSKISLTPLAAVVSTDESPAPFRDNRRDAIKPMITETAPAKPVAVSMEEIEEKLDQILEKDLQNV